MLYFPHKSVCVSSPVFICLSKAGPYGASNNFASVQATQSGFKELASTVNLSTRLRHNKFCKPEYLTCLKHRCHTSHGNWDVFAFRHTMSAKGLGATWRDIRYKLFFILAPFAIDSPSLVFNMTLFHSRTTLRPAPSSHHLRANKLFQFEGTCKTLFNCKVCMFPSHSEWRYIVPFLMV